MLVEVLGVVGGLIDECQLLLSTQPRRAAAGRRRPSCGAVMMKQDQSCRPGTNEAEPKTPVTITPIDAGGDPAIGPARIGRIAGSLLPPRTGSHYPPLDTGCPDGASCNVGTDCQSGVCALGVCVQGGPASVVLHFPSVALQAAPAGYHSVRGSLGHGGVVGESSLVGVHSVTFGLHAAFQ